MDILGRTAALSLLCATGLTLLLLPCGAAAQDRTELWYNELTGYRQALESRETDERKQILWQMIHAVLNQLRMDPAFDREEIIAIFTQPQTVFAEEQLQDNQLVDPVLLMLQGIVLDHLPAPAGKTDENQAALAQQTYARALEKLATLTWQAADKRMLKDYLQRLRDDALHFGMAANLGELKDLSKKNQTAADCNPYNPNSLVAAARFVSPHEKAWVRVTVLDPIADNAKTTVEVKIISPSYQGSSDMIKLGPLSALRTIELSPAAIREIQTAIYLEKGSWPMMIELLDGKEGPPVKSNIYEDIYSVRMTLIKKDRQRWKKMIKKEAFAALVRDKLRKQLDEQRRKQSRPNFYCSIRPSGNVGVYFGPFKTKAEADKAIDDYSLKTKTFDNRPDFTKVKSLATKITAKRPLFFTGIPHGDRATHYIQFFANEDKSTVESLAARFNEEIFSDGTFRALVKSFPLSADSEIRLHGIVVGPWEYRNAVKLRDKYFATNPLTKLGEPDPGKPFPKQCSLFDEND